MGIVMMIFPIIAAAISAFSFINAKNMLEKTLKPLL